MQSVQIARGTGEPNDFMAALSTKGNSFQQLETVDERLAINTALISGDIFVTVKSDTTGPVLPMSYFAYPSSFYVVSLKDGSRKFLKTSPSFINHVSLSPDGKWLIYYDIHKRNYCSYDLQSQKTRNITEHLPKQVCTDYPLDTSCHAVAASVGWIMTDTSVLIYDNYDLWKIDPANKRPAFNITAGYGAKHGIKLRLIDESDYIGTTEIRSLGDTLLMSGFNVKNKYNGFFRQVLGSKTEPALLTMGPYLYRKTYSQGTAHSEV